MEGIHRLMCSDHLATTRLVTIDELVDIIAEAVGQTIHKDHDLSRPQGVRRRNSDKRRLREVLEREPEATLEEGIVETYRWIEERMRSDETTRAAVRVGR